LLRSQSLTIQVNSRSLLYLPVSKLLPLGSPPLRGLFSHDSGVPAAVTYPPPEKIPYSFHSKSVDTPWLFSPPRPNGLGFLFFSNQTPRFFPPPKKEFGHMRYTPCAPAVHDVGPPPCGSIPRTHTCGLFLVLSVAACFVSLLNCSNFPFTDAFLLFFAIPILRASWLCYDSRPPYPLDLS